jgi:hypothetical protein
MRSQNLAWVLPFLVASVGLAGCAAPASDDGADDQTQDVTGGSSAIESPVVFLFESADSTVAPKCAGAMIADKFAVTAKSCAKVGLVIGHAADKDGHGARAQVTQVHTPPGAESDIAVVELDRPLAGTHALITHMPLRDGYAVNAFAATDGKGLFAPDKNEASSIAGTMVEETATHGSIVPAKGTEICDGDIGAPVCSSTGGKIAGFNLYGTCGLSGLVVSRVAPAAAAPPAAPGAPATPGADPAPAGTTPATSAACSGGAWKVAQLGRHAEFLKTFAPKAFQPWFIDKPILRNFPYYAPDGLWGYKTKGDVKACAIDAATLASVAPGASSPKLTAKVSFAGMEKNATAVGRFGIAPKSDPTNMRWLPAKLLGTAGGNSYSAQFEGVVSAPTAGDFVVAFRASANGGESWTSCDTDGIDNGFAVEKALSLKVADANAPSTNPSTPPSMPQSTPPSESGSEGTYSDPPASAGESSDRDPSGDAEEEVAPKKKESTDNKGCSISSARGSSGGLSGSVLPIAGVLFGLAALSRRRRAAR